MIDFSEISRQILLTPQFTDLPLMSLFFKRARAERRQDKSLTEILTVYLFYRFCIIELLRNRTNLASA